MSSDLENNGQSETGTTTVTKQSLKPPKMYKVIMHNDDYTTMEFVINVLQKFFNKSFPESQSIMLEVHTKGFGVCGVFTFEVAESKVAKVVKYARENGHPLKCTIEPS